MNFWPIPVWQCFVSSFFGEHLTQLVFSLDLLITLILYLPSSSIFWQQIHFLFVLFVSLGDKSESVLSSWENNYHRKIEGVTKEVTKIDEVTSRWANDSSQLNERFVFFSTFPFCSSIVTFFYNFIRFGKKAPSSKLQFIGSDQVKYIITYTNI